MRTPFEYLRPATPHEAVVMKARYGTQAQFWAGGTDLMLAWRQGRVAFDYCIDLGFLPGIDGIACEDEWIRIGAMTTLDDLDRASSRGSLLEVLGGTARLMCTPQTRTIATVGGNLCYAAPSADLSPLLIVLDAEAVITGSTGQRAIAIAEFAQAPNKTALADDEILVEVRIPIPTGRQEACYRRIARTSVDIALTGVAVALTLDGEGRIGQARIALGAVAPFPLRSQATEKMLEGTVLAGVDGALLVAAGERAAADARPISDLRASADYRRQMVRVLTRRAIEQAVGKLMREVA